MGTQARAFLLAFGVAAWALGCSPDSPDPGEPPRSPEARPHERPNLVLILIDNLRADHVGAYGYARPTTPTIDGLAARGVVFRNAFAPSSWTMPSVAALFTSRHPSEHGAVTFARPMNAALPTLAEVLRDAGYTTVGVSGNPLNVGERTKMNRGFERWRGQMVQLSDEDEETADWTEPSETGGPVRLRAPRAAEVNRQVRALLAKEPTGPLFLYVHYMEPHAGYEPPEPHRARFIREPGFSPPQGFGSADHVTALAAGGDLSSPAEKTRLIDLYDAEIATADAAIDRLLRWLEGRGMLENAIVVTLSDHGEAFGEHDSWFHGVSLHGELTRVPLIVSDLRAQRELPAGANDRRAVDLLDLAPTLIGLSGARPAPGMRGRDLFAAGAPASRELVGELHPDPLFAAHVDDRDPRLGLTRWPQKVIVGRDGGVQRFDLEDDPGELHDRAGGSQRDLEARAKALAAELDAAAAWGQPPDGALPIDERSAEGLRALGYIE